MVFIGIFGADGQHHADTWYVEDVEHFHNIDDAWPLSYIA